MKFSELARNLIETCRFCSFLYDLFCSSEIYRNFVNKKISQRLEYLKNHNEIKFMIETTSICNAKCIFCPHSSLKRPHIQMSSEIFEKIIYRIKSENITPVSFDLFMAGEPFLDKNIFDRIKILQDNFPNTPINITSNFSTADSSMINKLIKSGINSINISLNAANQERYKKLMGLDYRKTVNNINELIRTRNKLHSGLKISLSMVIFDEEKLRNIIKFFLQWIFKADTIRFQRASVWGGKINTAKPLGLSRKKLYPCNDLFERLPVLSSGDYALCCQDAEGIINLNISDTPILEAWQSKIYSEIRRINMSSGLKDFERCKNCFGTNSNGANWIFINR